ncbi:PREDICTED: uncharacterized protein LOC104594793 [Nelumbo nucifera]|uniref:Uncharacterized protein LOC104594793 n=1 Tax=Nelumbo nucifera TaxID=4432 RepID=A0A1U7ZI75_NELNU|nr:PREDICTED: uncharacterized protein LOC104594793 [Nelumbo nucifera]
MRLSSKPIASPGRADKFPPPLTRFGRNNGGNRSRGRARASPMFVRKKNDAVETQEPSSPKVTCMGQVRVRRSKQAAAKAGFTKAATSPKCSCLWIREALFCNRSAKKPKPRASGSVWRRWLLFIQLGYRKKVEVVENPARREPEPEYTEEESDSEEEDEEAKVFLSSSPPKNALLLMRCRSDPYRSSSLASRFWGSPSAAENAEEKTEHGLRGSASAEEGEEEEEPNLDKGPTCRDSAAESRMDPETEEKLGFGEGLESSSNARTRSTTKSEEETSKTIGGPARPLILTRCKSEPARRSGKLDPENHFWKKRRLRPGERFAPQV